MRSGCIRAIWLRKKKWQQHEPRQRSQKGPQDDAREAPRNNCPSDVDAKFALFPPIVEQCNLHIKVQQGTVQ